MNGTTRARIIASLRYLLELLEGNAEDTRILDGYLETRGTLAAAFKEVVTEQTGDGVALAEAAIADLRGAMLGLSILGVPLKYFRLRAPTGVRRSLLEYLLAHRGQAVTADRLRVLSGEQVHTERRIRELRDLGFEIRAETSSGWDSYCLTLLPQDTLGAAITQVEGNIKNDRKLPSATANSLIERVRGYEGAHLTQ